jgi:hypothetical protein
VFSVRSENHQIKFALKNTYEFPFFDPMPMRAHVSSRNSSVKESSNRVSQLSMEIKVHSLARRRGRTG